MVAYRNMAVRLRNSFARDMPGGCGLKVVAIEHSHLGYRPGASS
jgi:hypothetical protein